MYIPIDPSHRWLGQLLLPGLISYHPHGKTTGSWLSSRHLVCLLRRGGLLPAKQLDGSAPELLPMFAMDASAMDANV